VLNTGLEDLEKIIQGCIRKNEKSREMLYKKYFGYALSVALLYSSNRDDATEVVDDSFLKVFSEIGRFDMSQSFKGWLRKIVINKSIDRLRRNSRKIALQEQEALPLHDAPEVVTSHMTAQEILSMLNLLPQVQKTVFCLYEIEGYSHNEIADHLNIPESSSRVYLTRAKKKLRELFQVHYNINHI